MNTTSCPNGRTSTSQWMNFCPSLQLGQGVTPRAPSSSASFVAVVAAALCRINAAFCLVPDLPKELSSLASERARSGRARNAAGNGRSAKEKEWEKGREEGRKEEGGNFLGTPSLSFSLFFLLPIFSHLFPGQTFILNAVPGLYLCTAALRWVRTVGMKSADVGENRIHIMNCRSCQVGGGGGGAAAVPRGEELWRACYSGRLPSEIWTVNSTFPPSHLQYTEGEV